jgi:hypothetical protein
MPRSTVPKTSLLSSYPLLPLTASSADLVFTASTGSSGASGNQIPFGAGDLIVLMQNSHATLAYNGSFTSKVDKFNRTGDITAYNLDAGEIAVFHFKADGWRNSDGYLYCEGSNAAIKFAAFDV